ncbi:MAG: VanZ family protein [Calditrichaeota bacterium]|nr:VanZ family protein [Calditrichota bacterium]
MDKNTEGMERYYQFLKKHWVDFFIYSYIFFIIYSTIVPFNFINSFPALERNIGRIDWIPFQKVSRLIARLDRSDVLANVIFFIPLGIVLALKKILNYYRNFSLKDWLNILMTGLLISLMVEILQLFTYDRTTSVMDLTTNTLGTLLGAGAMLLLYLKFHRQIKTFLYFLFVSKPEMTISALFLAFIFLYYSAPFTYQPGLSTVKHSAYLLINSRPGLADFFNSLPVSIMMFTTFIYFLCHGIFRYFSRHFRRKDIIYLLIAVIILPVLLEIYQLLIPIRYHSINDILSAETGLFLGFIMFYYQFQWQNNEQEMRKDHLFYFRKYLEFFKVLAFIYIIYIVIFLLNDNTILSFVESFRILFLSGGARNIAFIKASRLEFLIQIAKEVFTFLPAGFILSLFWFMWRQTINWLYLVVGFVIIFFTGFYLVYLLKFSLDWYLIIHFMAVFTGFWAGGFFRKVYTFIMKVS